MIQRIVAIAVLCGHLAYGAIVLGDEKAPKTRRVYFVGNSVTDTINYTGLTELAKSRGYTQVWGRHMIPGAPLQWIWEHPNDGFQEPPFGHYPTALADFPWDVLSLQPFDRHLDGKDGDIAMAKNFIDLALAKSPDLQVYVYARWPRKYVGGKPFVSAGGGSTAPTPAIGKPTLFSGYDDFDTTWLKKYTGGWDNTNETKDYFERLTLELRKAYPKLKINMVPVGHVMYELNQRMKAGEISGFKTILDLYSDVIHLNNVGSYVVGCTYFATLYKESPKGLPSAPYKVEDAKLAAAIQDVVWRVVSTNELAGVKKAAETATLKSDSPVLLITWFLDKGIALRYDVSQKGEWNNVRDIFDRALQSDHRGQLSDKNLADLRGLLPKLPKSAAKPPIERSVVVSFERDGKWCTETYDSAKLPETLEKVMLIVGERGETRERKRERTDKASP